LFSKIDQYLHLKRRRRRRRRRHKPEADIFSFVSNWLVDLGRHLLLFTGLGILTYKMRK
jgi:hypothetical protein